MGTIQAFKLVKVSKGPKTCARLFSLQGTLKLSFDCSSPGIVPDWSAKALQSSLYGLLYDRRARINVLSKGGWLKLRTDKLNLLNCPPACCFSWPEHRECKTAYFCPFCWIRYVVDPVYDHLSWALFGTTRLTPETEPIRFTDIVLLQRRSNVLLSSYANSKALFDEVRARAKQICVDELSPFALGSCSIATLAPNFDSTFVELKENFVTLVVPGTNLDFICDAHGLLQTRVASNQLTDINLAKLVGAACQYPATLLTGDVTMTADILNFRAVKRQQSRRPPKPIEYWGYLRQYSVNAFDKRCLNAHKENHSKNETDINPRKDTG